MKPVIKNLRTTALACASLIAATLFSTTALAQTKTPATIPTSKLGTYTVTFTNAQPGSPLANGATATIVVAPGGTLCVAGMSLSNPMMLNGSNIEAHWDVSSANMSLALSSLVANFTVFNVYQANTTGGTSASGLKLFGQFNANKVSSSTTGCGTPAAPAVDPAKIEQVFTQAQQKLAQYFPATGASTTQQNGDYTYRFYSGTNIYLAINNGEVYVMGGAFGNAPIKQGPLETILSALTNMPVSIPEIPSGNARLVITGRVGTSGINVDIGSITLDNVPMVAGNDVDSVKKAVEDQYKSSGITGTIAVTLISSSSTQTVFNIKFNGAITQSGFTLTQNYDITYTYTKK